jgi:hypothetical protein
MHSRLVAKILEAAGAQRELDETAVGHSVETFA